MKESWHCAAPEEAGQGEIHMEQMIRDILTEIVGREAGQADRQEDLRELGLDSVAFIQMVVALEEAVQREVSDEYLLLDAMNTIEKIEEAMK